MTQQAVSKSIGQLERDLGFPLFDRSTHDVSLTPAGAELLLGLPSALSTLDDALERARNVGRGVEGTIEVGVSPALGDEERREVVSALRVNASSLSVVLHEIRPEQAVAALRERRVALTFARSVQAVPGIEGAALRATPASLFVPTGHRLAQPGRKVRLRELDGERLLVWNEPGTPLTDALVGLIAAAGAVVTPVLSRAAGLGVSLSDLLDSDAIAVAPRDARCDAAITRVAFDEPVTLPVVVMWTSAARPAALGRVLERLGETSGVA